MAEAVFDGFEQDVALSEPLIPALTTARQAMISRSWASMTKAPRTMSPFRAG